MSTEVICTLELEKDFINKINSPANRLIAGFLSVQCYSAFGMIMRSICESSLFSNFYWKDFTIITRSCIGKSAFYFSFVNEVRGKNSGKRFIRGDSS